MCHGPMDLLAIFTARKRSLRRLCFYTCLPFCSWGGSASVHAGIPYPPGADTPPCAVHAGRYGQQAGGMHPTGMQSCNYNNY